MADDRPRLIVRPGAGLAARRGQAVLFVASADDPAAPSLLEALQRHDSGDIDDALFAVVRAHRPAPVTAFCLLFTESESVRVVIHGRIEVLAVVDGKQVALQGREAHSRVEESISGAIEGIAVGEHRPELADHPLLNLVEGVVSAGALQLTRGTVERSVALSVEPTAEPETAEQTSPESTVLGMPPPPLDEEVEAAFEHRPTLAVAATPSAGPQSPEVEGVMCPAGHFNSPEISQCSVCGQPLGEELVRRPRPPLGRLLTKDGREFTVNGPMIIGRKPGQAPEVLDGSAVGVEVPVTETAVSRTHAQLLVEGWAVLVKDLGSANGTYVLPANVTEWFRVEPDHPIEIVPGTVIAVGGFEIKFDQPEARVGVESRPSG